MPSTGTLPPPPVSTMNTVIEQHLRLDCGFRGIPIELEYRSVEISGSSDVVVRRSRSCFVVGEISRVTVWFVSGGHISSVPAVVNATSGEGEEHAHNVELKQMHEVGLYALLIYKTPILSTGKYHCIKDLCLPILFKTHLPYRNS